MLPSVTKRPCAATDGTCTVSTSRVHSATAQSATKVACGVSSSGGCTSTVYIEHDLEERLRTRLSDYGFKVLKLTTPGNIGCMDRMVLMPRYSPGPPLFVEIKKPGKKLRPLQEAIAIDWRLRGCIVLRHCSTMEQIEQLCDRLIAAVKPDYAFASLGDIYDNIPSD